MFSTITMNKRQLLSLCLCAGFLMFQGSSMGTLLPVYAVRLGANPATTGAFLAFTFFTLSIGTLGGGWLADRFGHRKRMLLLSYGAWIPAVLLMTQVTDIVQLTIITSVVWFFGGVAFTMINTLAGLSAAAGERGKIFGLLALAVGVGTLLSGLISGPIVDRWGFPALFVAMGSAGFVVMLIASFLKDEPVRREVASASTPAAPPVAMGRLFYLVLGANFFVQLAVFVANLGRPLAMTGLNFDATAISGAVAVSALITLPLPLLIGSWSDRIGRRRFLIGCYVVGMVGVVLLIPAQAAWQFWLSATAIAAINASGAVSQAMVADLVPARAMGKGMSQFATTTWAAGIIGFGSAGVVMQSLGIGTTLLIASLLPLVAIGLLSRLRQPVVVPIPA